MKEIKLIEVLKVKFEKKKQGNKIKNKTAYFNSKPFTITNGIEFTVNVKQYDKIEKEKLNDIIQVINVFSYVNKQPYPISVSKEKFENKKKNLLLITEDENKHCISIKDFNRFMFNQTKHKEKNIFVCSVYKFSAKKVFSRNTKLSVMSSMVNKLSECLIKER